MIPRLHPKGHSFKGAAAYLLHDKKAETANRVAWTETRNLATRNPEAAWRVMSATSMSQERLKARAGIKNTGRKSNAHVLHFSLSWSEEEAGSLSRDEMLRAAHGALRALSAGDRQALIVSHNDEPHPHVHILLNRVSAEDGRVLSSSKEKLVLSKWAEEYERERGRILCEERVINNAARDRKQYTRGGDQSRPAYEHEGRAIDGNRDASRRARLAALAKSRRELAARQAAEWKAFEASHKARLAEIAAAARRATFAQEKAIRERYRPAWTLLFHEHQASRREHEKNERSVVGRAGNTLKAIDFAAILRSGTRSAALGEAFKALSSSGARLKALKSAQAAEAKDLALRQQREERAAAAVIAAERRQQDTAERKRFLLERSGLAVGQEGERARLQTSWRALPRRRRNMGPVAEARPAAARATDSAPLSVVFQNAAQPPVADGGAGGDARVQSLAALNKEALRRRRPPAGVDRDKERDDHER